MLSSASKKYFTKENEVKYLSYKKKPNLILVDGNQLPKLDNIKIINNINQIKFKSSN